MTRGEGLHRDATEPERQAGRDGSHLAFPTDLHAWRRWQARKSPVRNAIALVRGNNRGPEPSYFIARRGGPTKVLIVLESRAASSRLALLSPISELEDVAIAVIAPFDPRQYLPGDDWHIQRFCGDLAVEFPELSVTAAAGHFLPLGALTFADAKRRDHRFVTVQHGLLTPVAPPLAPAAPALVWSEADGDFWRSGRTDVETVVVGSQLLWEAAKTRVESVSEIDRPVFLGQLHAAELSRLGMTRDITRFCRETGASYRPHPSETDKLSRLQHRAWELMGIELDRSGIPLTQLQRPVVGVFSTGLLEAAARGVPAWSFASRPAPWLRDLWKRYGIHPWGESPTPPPASVGLAPATTIANWIRGAL